MTVARAAFNTAWREGWRKIRGYLIDYVSGYSGISAVRYRWL